MCVGCTGSGSGSGSTKKWLARYIMQIGRCRYVCMYVNIRRRWRHQHTRVHAHTGPAPRQTLRAPPRRVTATPHPMACPTRIYSSQQYSAGYQGHGYGYGEILRAVNPWCRPVVEGVFVFYRMERSKCLWECRRGRGSENEQTPPLLGFGFGSTRDNPPRCFNMYRLQTNTGDAILSRQL